MLSALDLAHELEQGKLQPADVIDRCAEAIAAREAEIGAFACLDIEGARERARASVSHLLRRPLRGLPAGLKDVFDTADFPTEYGSPIYAGHRLRADSALAAQLRRAGGVILGKTTTTEFAYMQPARTRNPVNARHTPGGSSSGSAAAVAAGMLPIAFGTQTGGSVIRPAAYCGVTGFKPSYKLLPTVGAKCFSWHLDTVGLFAASVRDAAFSAAALTGRDLRLERAADVRPRLALVRTQAWSEASEEMRAAVERAAELAAAAGAPLVELKLPPAIEDGVAAHGVIQDYEAYRSLAYEYDRVGDRLSETLRSTLDAAAAITPEMYDAARRAAKRARRALAELMAETDAILTPSAPSAAPLGLESTGKPTFNRLWTLLGNPCVNVRGLADPLGLPLGVQIVGRFGRDKDTLAAADFLERALG